MMKLILALLTGVSLVSCATGPFYQQGPPDLSKSAMFTPQNEINGGFLKRSNFMLGEIDGMSRGYPVRFPSGEKGFAVTPGNHQIGVGVYHGEPGGGMVSAQGTIPMKVQAGKIYEVMGLLKNREQVEFWIRERSTQKKVSQIISVAAKDHGLPTTTIMIPAS